MKKAVRNVCIQMLSLLIRREFLWSLSNCYCQTIEIIWNEGIYPDHTFCSQYTLTKTPKNTKYYRRKIVPWNYRVRTLHTPDKILFKTKRVSCTDSRNWVPSGQMQSLLKEPPLFSLCCCCRHWESLSNHYHLTNTRIRILYLHSWTFQEPLYGHFNMINVGIWYP